MPGLLLVNELSGQKLQLLRTRSEPRQWIDAELWAKIIAGPTRSCINLPPPPPILRSTPTPPPLRDFCKMIVFVAASFGCSQIIKLTSFRVTSRHRSGGDGRGYSVSESFSTQDEHLVSSREGNLACLCDGLQESQRYDRW